MKTMCLDKLKTTYDYKDGNLIRREDGGIDRAGNPNRRWKKGVVLGSYNKKLGYLVTSQKCIDGKVRRLYIHRLIWQWHNGPIQDGYTIDHINMDRMDNRIENLRVLTPRENVIASTVRLRKNNSSGKSGVSWNKGKNKWRARISDTIDGKKKEIFLGYFDDLDEAIKARENAEISFGYKVLHNKTT